MALAMGTHRYRHDNAAILTLLARLARAAAHTRQAAEGHSTKMAR